MQISPKRERTSTKSKFSASVFEDKLKRLERTDFAVVRDSSSTRAGPSVALQKLEVGESLDKVLSWRAAIRVKTLHLAV